MKRYWGVWVFLLLVSLLVVALGPSIVGSFFFTFFKIVFGITAFGGLMWYTLGRGNMSAWGLLRLIGAIGLFISISLCIETMEGFGFDEFFWKQENAIRRSNFIVFAGAGIFSVIFIGLGEISYYLYKMNHKLRLMNMHNEYLKKLATETICPRCIGKGYIDFNDIKRFDKVNSWSPGKCNYCGGTGHVYRGKAVVYDPADKSKDSIFGDPDEVDRDFENFVKEYDKNRTAEAKEQS